MKELTKGTILERYIPWEPGLRKIVVIEKRIPKDGELCLTNDGKRDVFIRRGSAYLGPSEKKREYWIVEEAK